MLGRRFSPSEAQSWIRKIGRNAEADKMEARAKAIRVKRAKENK